MKSSALNLHALLVGGGQVKAVPVLFDGGTRCFPRFVSTPTAKDAVVELKNETEILGVSAKRPSKKVLKEVYQDWNKGKEKSNPFLKKFLLPDLWVRV